MVFRSNARPYGPVVPPTEARAGSCLLRKAASDTHAQFASRCLPSGRLRLLRDRLSPGQSRADRAAVARPFACAGFTGSLRPEIAVRRPRHDPVSRLTASIFGQAMTGSIDCLALAPIRSGGSRIGSCGAQTSRDVSSWSSGMPSNRCPWLPSLPLMVR